MYLLGQASPAAKQRLLDSELLQADGITDADAVRNALGLGPGFVGTDIHDAPSKNPPVDADEFGIADSADGWSLKKLTWANIKTALTSAFFPLNAVRHGNLGGGSLHAAATTSVAGFMSSSDKTKLNGLPNGIGQGQTWQDVSGSRTQNTSYQNTTGKPIMVFAQSDGSGDLPQVSVNNSTWLTIGIGVGGTFPGVGWFIVPNSYYYRIAGSGTPTHWLELR